MIKFIDTSFHKLDKLTIKEAAGLFHASYGYLAYLKKKMSVEIIFHGERDEQQNIDGVHYSMFKGRRGFFSIPLKALLHIRRQEPDVVLVQGLIFPVQVMLLRLFLLGRKCAIIAQHHKETPYDNFFMLWCQRLVDVCISRYLFTSKGNLYNWERKNIIRDTGKVVEVLEGSTSFKRLDKRTSGNQLGIEAENIFLWVGRLYENKDPLTVLRGFRQYLDAGNSAELYMIYQVDDLLAEVKEFINTSAALKKHVHLTGRVAHHELQAWLSAADYFILGSHYEGSGYALVEAMACGCIPVVTDIPTFRKITGGTGFLFSPGDEESLYRQLLQLNTVDKIKHSEKVVRHFKENLSFEKIAGDINAVCESLDI